MNRKIKKLFIGLNLLLIISISAMLASAQTAGAINGKIKWKKSYGRPEGAQPCNAIDIVAYTESGSTVGNAMRLSFAETGEDYECSYNITRLPEGIPLRVSVTPSKGYDWLDDQTTSSRIYSYRREFHPLAWSGEVTLLRTKPDLPSRATGNFEMTLVASKIKEKILVNPKTRLPNLHRPLFEILRRNY
jgi:hypothetical protein